MSAILPLYTFTNFGSVSVDALFGLYPYVKTQVFFVSKIFRRISVRMMFS